MGSIASKILENNPALAALAKLLQNHKNAVGGTAALGLLYMYWQRKQARKKSGKKKKKNKHRVRVDREFFRRLKRVLVSSCSTREAVNAVLLTSTLLCRTVLSVWMANHLGRTVNAFCNQNWVEMKRLTMLFAAVTVAGGVLNASLKYYAAMLVQNLRQCITRYIHDIYMQPGKMIFYKANKVGVDKLENADQLITDDVEKFCETCSEVFSQALKPLVDFAVFSFQLWRVQGLVGPLGLYTWFFIATVISVKVMPSYGRLAATKQRLEGYYRAAHADLITNCEQIAFMGGERPEKNVLNKRYDEIHQHALRSIWSVFSSNVVQQYVNKYFASVVGLGLIAQPVYFNLNGMASLTPGDIARYYVSTSRIMAGLSDAVLALFDMSNRVGRLAGLTHRVDSLLQGLQHREPVLEQEIAEHTLAGNPPRFVPGDVLKFENVSVYRPDGVCLVKNLNFEVKKGARVIITGGNGCGKSSLFRVLRGLWPLVCGTITKPPNSEIYFLSQVNFVPLGSLRDLIIYPDTVAEMKEKGRTDDDLAMVMKWADLEGLAFDGKRPSLDDVREWGVDLSPGQKQRMAFARLLYHRPRYAVLDECTNGISPDVEASLYARCRKLGMSVFSISHKIELKQLHDFELHYNQDAESSYTWTRCDLDSTTSLDLYKRAQNVDN